MSTNAEMLLLNCISFNARSLKNKLPDLHFVLYNEKLNYDILFITETWLSTSVTDAMLDPKGLYTVYRCDRSNGRAGGGVCVLVKACHSVLRVDLQLTSSSFECVCFDLFISHSVMRMFLVYRPPSTCQTNNVGAMTDLVNCLAQQCVNTSTTCILGDMNCPNIYWDAGIVVGDIVQKIFHDFTTDQGLVQFVNSPTRGSNILDIVLCNDPLFISDVQTTVPFSNSDHNSIVCVLNVAISKSAVNSNCYNQLSSNIGFKCNTILWAKANWSQLEIFYSQLDWDVIISTCSNSDECWNSFYDTICMGIKYFIPSRSVKCNKTGKNFKQSKYPKRIKKLLSRKAVLWRKLRVKPKNRTLKSRYKLIANTCKDQILLHEKSCEHKILDGSDLGCFFKYVNSKMGRKSSVAPLKAVNGDYIFDDYTKAELLNNCFSNNCVSDNGSLPELTLPNMTPDKHLNNVVFTQTGTFKTLQKQKNSLASGPDNIPPLFYKKLAACLSIPLTLLFRKIAEFGCLPTIWKRALVTPIYKKGSSSHVENYRPISLTCVACKIFETTVKQQLVTYLLSNNLLNASQHGFLSGHSTTTNLLESLNDWTINIKNVNNTRIAFIDFKSAFDSVSHAKLLFKLSRYGIKGNLLQLITSFLSDRKQSVVLNGVNSSEVSVISGVPQGSVLGPILFVIYINDLGNIFQDKASLNCYADDAKLYSVVNNVQDLIKFQDCLDKLSQWAEMWQLSLNINKCCTIDVGHSTNTDLNLPNSINSVDLEQCCTKIDLGVKIDSKLTFSLHVADVVTKSKQRLFMIFRAFTTRNVVYLLRGYKAYVLPLLSYCSSVWCPYYIEDILSLESVQRLFTRRLPGFEDLSYNDRLLKLHLPTLELRRLRSDLLLCYNILHGKVAGSAASFGLQYANNINMTRGHNLKLIKLHCRTDTRKHFWGSRVVTPWNGLPENIVNAPSGASFKNLISKYDLSKYLKINWSGQ